jgi:hypothetical protein
MAKFPPNPKWELNYSDELVKVWINDNDDIHLKVKITNGKSKQFYNETAYSDVPRFIVDETGYMKYWSLFV